MLRPQPGAAATVAAAQALGLEAVAVSLFEVVPVAWEVPDLASYAGLVVTSANAVRHGGDGLAELRHLPLHAVGEATAAAAREAGFTVAGVGNGGVDGLALPPGRHLHLAGRHHLPLPGEVDALVVYDSRAIEPPPELDLVTDAVIAVHSARAGRRLAELVAERGNTAIVAISQRAAEACGAGWKGVAVAPTPDDPALLALARKLCHKPLRR